MKSLIVSVWVILTIWTGAALAQQQGSEEVVWIQIEAHPSRSVVRERAQLYESRLEDVNGFSLGGSWYGILLGPYKRADAEQAMRVYRSRGEIPNDAFIAYTRNLGEQIWPEGADVLNRQAAISAPVAGDDTGGAIQQGQDDPVRLVQPADESPAEARRSERLLSPQERKDLQIALTAAGFYFSSIDGAFGPGTRRSMEDWQINRGYEATGILTTAQRAALIEEYNAPLTSVGMELMHDLQAGIEMQLPLGVVKFSRYEPPFAHFEPTDDLGARVLLISQPGEKATLFGLYDIMQTLEIVPLNGPRERGKDSFTLEGRGNGIVSYTQAALKNGEIKGFTLVWPEGDEDRRARVLAEMKASFTRTEGVLDPGAGASAEQSVDLVSGLEIRKPRLSRSGFFVDARGTVVTTDAVVDACTRITLDGEYRATLLTSDTRLGVAVLSPEADLTPVSVARLRSDQARLQSDVAVAGYSYEGALGGPTLTFGTLADVRGLAGEDALSRLALTALPGDAGGPVLDAGGSVLGMLLAQRDGARKLPENVSLAADAAAIRALVETAGVSIETPDPAQVQEASDLNKLANGMTVLVSCWN